MYKLFIFRSLPKPEDCDLAVIVLWSRIGTQLPADFELKEDGSPYLSGTEWEYLNALKGFKNNRKPAVWVYRREGAPNPDLDDPGEFEMGDLSGDGQADQRPVHTVRFAKEFEMGKYEVTFEEYDLFASATGRDKPNDEGWGRGDQPVIHVSWIEAVAYAAWLSQRTGLNYRLPSEAEWEYAARANTTTFRYWSEAAKGEQDAACTYANVFDAKNELRLNSAFAISWKAFNCTDEFPFTAPVGQFAANQWELQDILGNVSEWTQDCHSDSYEDAPMDGSPLEFLDIYKCTYRVLRGGSWGVDPQMVSSAHREISTPVDHHNTAGFRLARPGHFNFFLFSFSLW